MRPGEQLMVDAWIEGDWPTPLGFSYDDDVPSPPFNVDHDVPFLIKVRSAPRPDRSFDLPDEDPDVDYRALEEAQASVRADVQASGVHALAWYMPYRLHGAKKWGVYFDVAAMDMFARDLYDDARRLDPLLTMGTALDYAYMIVTRHEVEHLVQELIMAESVTSEFCAPIDVMLIGLPALRASMEVVATQMELIDRPPARPTFAELTESSLAAAWSQIGFPDPYSRWSTDSRASHEATMLRRLQRTDGDAFDAMREEVGGWGNSRYVAVPVYLWLGSDHLDSISGASLRLSVDCKKVRRGLLRASNTELAGVPFTVEAGASHELKVYFKGAKQPIPFGCHAWDKVPDKVVSEFAKAVGQSRRDVIRALASL